MRDLLLFFFSHRTLALIRWDIHFFSIRIGNVLFWRTGRLLKEIRKKSGPVYLNLGSGPRGSTAPEWVNIDGFKDKNVHYLCDFSRPLPFDNDTFDGIFCEHVLEHFTYEQGQILMEECKRILKKGGVIRIIIPDGQKILSSYFHEPSKIVEYKQVKSGIPMEAVNIWFYQRYEHQCIYDADYLLYMLNKSGYTTTLQSSFNNTSTGTKEIVLDDPKYSYESLYAEAVK